MFSFRRILQTALTCGLVPLLLWSGLPRLACVCAAAEQACRCTAAEEDAQRHTCSRPCCARKAAAGAKAEVAVAARQEQGPVSPGLNPPSLRACRCALGTTHPTADRPERRGGQDLPAANVGPHVALPDAPAALPTIPHPSHVHLPPLDRTILFCVLLV